MNIMTAQLIDGKAVATALKSELRELVQLKMAAGMRQPGLAVILVGEDPASSVYVRNKGEACKLIGIRSIHHQLSADISEQELINLIIDMNHDPAVDGILVQLPLPSHIDAEKVLETINPHKDVDGFHAYNLGRLAQRRPLLRPCTPQGR